MNVVNNIYILGFVLMDVMLIGHTCKLNYMSCL